MPIVTASERREKYPPPWLWVLLAVPGLVILLLLGVVGRLVTVGWVDLPVLKISKHEIAISLHTDAGSLVHHAPGYQHRDIEVLGIPRSLFYYRIVWK